MSAASITVRSRLGGIIGNILEHYDNALFGLLAPFIAPLFFGDKDPLTALILTYGMLPLGILMRPLGSLFFGWIGDRWGRTHALCFSLLGMAFATMAMGCLPVYSEVGICAPIFLLAGRLVQNFCAAGETVGGAIFVLEHTPSSRRSVFSSLYDASSMGGILLASGLVTFFSYRETIAESWRLLFWLGGISAILGLFLRRKASEGSEFLEVTRRVPENLFRVLKEHRKPLLAVILVAGFSYTTFSLALTLMNGYVPMVTQLSKSEVMQINTILLFLDMLLLPFFGYLAAKVGKERLMFTAALCAIISAFPLFHLLQDARIEMVIAVRLLIVLLGVAFSSTYHAWALDRVSPPYRYTILSLGYAIGSQLIGAPSSAVCLWLYQKTGWISSPALYLMTTAALAGYVVYRSLPQRVAKHASG